jgi:hypothetical protein
MKPALKTWPLMAASLGNGRLMMSAINVMSSDCWSLSLAYRHVRL